MSLIDPCRESMVLLDGHAAKQSSKYIYVYNHRSVLLSIMVRETVFFSFQSPKLHLYHLPLPKVHYRRRGGENIRTRRQAIVLGNAIFWIWCGNWTHELTVDVIAYKTRTSSN